MAFEGWRRRGRERPPSVEVSSALADLDRLSRNRPELTGPARVLGGVLLAVFDEPHVAFDATSLRDAIVRGWSEGHPAFRVAPPTLDSSAVKERAIGVCEILRKNNPAAAGLRDVIRTGQVNLAALAPWMLADEEPVFLDPGPGAELIASVGRLALLPMLATASKAIGEAVPLVDWRRGTCPHCGNLPLLAESRGLEQSRFLRCGFCAADWPAHRLWCPSCETQEASLLRYEFAEGEEQRCRVCLCDHCGARLKVVSTLAPLSAAGLLVAELATVHLDWIE